MALVRTRYHRTKLANRSRTLAGVDGRSRESRRFNEIFASYLEQAPGQEHLARIAASLVLQNEELASRIVRGEQVDPLASAKLVGALHETLNKMGVSAGPAPE